MSAESSEVPTEDGAPVPLAALRPGAHQRNSNGGGMRETRSASFSVLSSPSTPAAVLAPARSSRVLSTSGIPNSVMGTVDESMWVPDDMAKCCCLCKAEFNMYRRRHHCRTCGRVACDDCSSNRIRGDRTCKACWDRLGRKMSGLGLDLDEDPVVAAATLAATGGVRKSALLELLQEERFNREFVLSDGRTVSYSVAGVADGLPVFLFLGLDAHRHSAALFEDVARRRGLRLICIDRPGRGRSDPIPPPESNDEDAEGDGGDPQALISEAIEDAVVDTVKQLCTKLRIGTAGVMGQSLGALFALRCARDEGLKDTLNGTTTTSSIPALAGTLGRFGGDIMVNRVGEMARGSGGASEVEKGYLEAPYTQDLTKHISGLKEGKESLRNEVFLALRNHGEDKAKERCAATIHAVHIWHGRSDQLVPYAAMEWLKQALPSCETTVIPGGTHALIHDKANMEDLFTVVQKGISDAKASARFSARRLSSQLSYVASSVFSSGGGSASSPVSGAAAAATASGGGGGIEAGRMSPRSGRKGKKSVMMEAAEDKQGRENGNVDSGGGGGGGVVDDTSSDGNHPESFTDRVVRAMSMNTGLDLSTHSSSSPMSISRHDRRRARSSEGTSGGPTTPRGSQHGGTSSSNGLGSGSGHGSSGHGISWHSLGLGGGSGGVGAGAGNGNGSGQGAPGRRSSGGGGGGSGGGNSRHSLGSWHGSDAATPSIPENGELIGLSGSDNGNSLFGEVGKHMSLALSSAFGSEKGSLSGGGGDGEFIPPPPLASSGSTRWIGSEGGEGEGGHGLVRREGGERNLSYHSETGSEGGARRAAEGFLRQIDDAVTSFALGRGSGGGGGGGGSTHGSEWDGSMSAAGSAHGGSTLGGSTHGSVHGSVHGGGRGSRNSSGSLLPWSQHGGHEERGNGHHGDDLGGGVSSSGKDNGGDDMIDGLMRGVERALSAVGVGPGTGGAVDGSPRPLSSGTGSLTTPHSVVDVSAHNISFISMGNRSTSAAEAAAAAAVSKGAGYAAAMANWPAGKIHGNPAWEEWAPEKKLACHVVTASCLAMIIVMW